VGALALPTEACGESCLDLAGLREAAQRALGEDRLAVELDLEDPAFPFDQLGFEVQLLADRVRQTGGTGVVVSRNTVFDGQA